MKAFEIKRLMAVALVAGLPVACGTNSPTGIDVDALGTEGTLSALRSEPGLPPTAPEAPSPLPVPTADPMPVPGINDPASDDSVPAPGDRGSRPGQRPNNGPPSNDPVPDIGSVPVPQEPADGGAVPAPPVSPMPAPRTPAAPVVVPPPPPQQGDDDARVCRAVAAEIMILRGSFPQPLYGNSVLLEIAMLDKDGRAVGDGSCQGVQWSIEIGSFAADAIITVGADNRFASVSGLAGGYMIRAIAPNGLTATVAITLQ